MKTKIGLPFGLALVMFIGLFTTMLALGVLTPNRADAAAMAGTVELTLSDKPQSSVPKTVTIEFTNDTTPITNSVPITITLVEIDGSDDSVDVRANWKLYIDGEEQTDADAFTVTGDPNAVTVTPRQADSGATPPVEALDISGGAMVKLMFTSVDTGAVPLGLTNGD